MLTRKVVHKPTVDECYHYFDESGEYVGAVWRSDVGGGYRAFCTKLPNYGSIEEDFSSREQAEQALEKLVNTDK